MGERNLGNDPEYVMTGHEGLIIRERKALAATNLGILPGQVAAAELPGVIIHMTRGEVSLFMMVTAAGAREIAATLLNAAKGVDVEAEKMVIARLAAIKAGGK